MKERIKELIPEKEKSELVLRYYNILKEWSSKINLIARKDIEGNFLNLLKTSIFLYKKLSEYNCFIDIGAGAGFPSIPGKILYPEKKFVLVEPSKRYFFLTDIVKRLNLKGIDISKKSFLEFFSKGNEIVCDFIVSWGVRDKNSMLKAGKNFVKIGYVFITGPREIEKMKRENRSYEFYAEKIEGKDKLFVAFAKKVPRGT